jgi:hypothetical protein
MTFLRRIFGEDAMVSSPAQASATPAPAPAPTPEEAAQREAALHAELAGADATQLATFAREDKRAAMRLMAAEALVTQGASKEVWESIVSAWQQKDRRLTKLAKSQLAAFRSADDFHSHVATLEEGFKGLLDKHPTDLTRLGELDRAYELLKADARKLSLEADLQAIAVVRGAIAERLGTEQDAQRSVMEVEKLAHAVTAGLVAGTAKADTAQQHAQHAELAEKLAAIDVTGVPPAVVQRAQTALTNLAATIAAAANQEEFARQQAARAAEAAAGADAKAANDAKKAEHQAEAAARKEKAKGDEARMKQLVESLEAQLASGEAKGALKQVAQVKALRSVAEHAAPDWRARFHAVEGEVLKLEGFARDNARTRRDELLDRAKKLPELSLPPDALANEIQSLQNQWKAIDAEVGGAPGKLWDTFHAATNVAYEKVKVFRAAQAAIRDEHGKEKEAILAELEALAAPLRTAKDVAESAAKDKPEGGAKDKAARGAKAGRNAKASGDASAAAPIVAGDAASAEAVSEVISEAASSESVSGEVTSSGPAAVDGLAANVADDAAKEVAAGTAEPNAAKETPPAVQAESSSIAQQASASAEVATAHATAQSTPPANIDWKALQSARSTFPKKWFAVGAVNRKDQKPLQVRFDKAMKVIERAMDAERAKEKRRRETLVKQVEAAKASAEAARPEHVDAKSQAWPALLDAMKVAQEAQKQWNARVSGLPLLHKDEQRLWDSFRTTCNSVFEMRSAARESVKAAAHADREKHAAVIAQLHSATAAAKAAGDEKALQVGVSEAMAAWRALPRADHGAARKFDDAVESAQKETKHLRRAKARGAWQALADFDAALGGLEAAPGDADKLAAVEAARAACDAKQLTQPDLAARLKAALAGSAKVTSTAKAERLIDIEMALQLSSPPEEAALRRARQMAQLVHAMKNRTARPEPTALFLAFVATAGQADAQRVARVVARL